MNHLLALYDPSGGLTRPSPCGGAAPLRYECLHCKGWVRTDKVDHYLGLQHRRVLCCGVCAELLPQPHARTALALRAEDGTFDLAGLARAREALALGNPCCHSSEDVSRGVMFYQGWHEDGRRMWFIQTCTERTGWPVVDGQESESVPDALARFLATFAKCEVIRG